MNKYIKNIVLKSSIIGIIALLFVSCSDDFLDRHPLSSISTPTFWSSGDEADMALMGVYSRLNNATFSYPQSHIDVMGGDAHGPMGVSQFDFTQLAHGHILPTSGRPINHTFADCYRGIASANYFLENIDRVQEMSETLKTQYKAEVRFLRALFYFTLAEAFGGVPLHTSTLKSIEEGQVKQSSKEDVIAQVLNDLEYAIANLPNISYSGSAVKGSALALKAKVAIHNQQWQVARDASQQLIQDGVFSLFDNYRAMFIHPGQDDNPEIIFSTKYQYPDKGSAQLYISNCNPLDEFVDAFECIDGLPINSSPLYDPDDRTANRDPRLMLTVKKQGEPWYDYIGNLIEPGPTDHSATGWIIIKGQNLYNQRPLGQSEDDWILLRYAEVLMIYAEAQNELNGPDASVYEAINEVRARPGIDMPPIPNGLTKDEMRTRIMHERRVEFGMEGKRYFDHKRWRTAEIYFPTVRDPGMGYRVFDPEKHYLWPFPQGEIDINPNLVQNPGY